MQSLFDGGVQMKQSEIEIGGTYSNGALSESPREVTDIEAGTEFSPPLDGKYVWYLRSGHKGECSLKHFASWAKERVK